MDSSNQQKPFAVDPYIHQPDSDHKLERCWADQKILCGFLEMNAKSVFDASKKYVNREADFFRFIFAVRFLKHALQNELKASATTLKVVSLIFTVEGIAPSCLPNQERLKRFLVAYVSREEKLRLLSGFLFGKRNGLGEVNAPRHHLMFEGTLQDPTFHRNNFLCHEPNCQTTSCSCPSWLTAQPEDTITGYTEVLGGRLYQMRCAVVHDATPVLFASSEARRPKDAAVWAVTLVDAFMRDARQSFVTYDSRLLVEEIVAIFRNGLRRCFEDDSLFQIPTAGQAT